MIAAASSGTVNIRIPNVFCGEFIENLDEIRVRVIMSNIADVSSDTGENGDITITSMKLRVSDVQFRNVIACFFHDVTIYQIF